MTPAQTIARDKAIQWLRASGARFAVETEPGVFVGDLHVTLRSPGAPRRKQNDWEKEFDYIKTLHGMKPGSSHVWTVADPARITGFQSALTARAHHFWGPGNYMTARTGNAIELLRIA